MGATCCAGEESKYVAPDAGTQPKNQMDEEMVKAPSPAVAATIPPAAAAINAAGGKPKEWTIVVQKTPGGPRLGVDVDLSDGIVLLIDKVNDGLVNEWNKANPDKEVRKDDRVVSVNGSRGNAQQLAEVCKRDDTLEMVIERDPE
mmetsp:Transcript_77611/g.239622  ORF Transcript_77611/g.239622 Transcript_77611/m.239622 type:complete len:145 (+) Transcript_77611:63-497(+)